MLTVERYRDDPHLSDVVRTRQYVGEHVVSTAANHLINVAVAA